MSDSNSASSSLATFLNSFAAIIGIATVALLLMSLGHEYGYFWIVGSKFQTFLTATDYLSNAVLWLPSVALALYAYIDWDVVLGQRRYSFGWREPVALLLVAIALWFVMGSSLVPTPLLFSSPIILLWLLYGDRLLPSPLETVAHLRQVIYAAPVLIIVLFSWGVLQGEGDLQEKSQPFTVKLKGGKVVARDILRTFDKGILMRDAKNNRIVFVRWDEVIQISHFARAPSEAPLCSWLNLNCPEKASAP